MKKAIILFCITCIVNLGFAQEKTASFPESVLGIYKGKLHISTPKGKQEIDMEFHIQKTDVVNRFDYKLVYSENLEIIRLL